MTEEMLRRCSKLRCRCRFRQRTVAAASKILWIGGFGLVALSSLPNEFTSLFSSHVTTYAWSPLQSLSQLPSLPMTYVSRCGHHPSVLRLSSNDGTIYDDEDAKLIGSIGTGRGSDLDVSLSSSSATNEDDVTLDGGGDDDLGCTTRLFRFGVDVTMDSYVGSMGFQEVTDWEYFVPNDDDDEDDAGRTVVRPPPFDPNTPRRTKTSTGSVVRLYRGRLLGRPSAVRRSRGLDDRVLIKEFTGSMAIRLALGELRCHGKLVSSIRRNRAYEDYDDEDGDDNNAKRRQRRPTVIFRNDADALLKLMEDASTMPFVAVLGRIRPRELMDVSPNEWYRAFGLNRSPDDTNSSVWMVYEYAGLTTLRAYATSPPEERRSRLPRTRNFFGMLSDPAPLPSFRDRANYVVQGILRKSLEALAVLHENGVVHRSVGRDSLVLTTQPNVNDKSLASSIYTINPRDARIKLSDFGFAGLLGDSREDDEFVRRARAFGIQVEKRDGDEYNRGGTATNAAGGGFGVTNFAIAEDLHSLGFVFLGVLLTSLAEMPPGVGSLTTTASRMVPDTDEDALQRTLGEIFGGDMDEFRAYCAEEEVWTKVVELLDRHDGAGWTLLRDMCFARERARDESRSDRLLLITARTLLSSDFFRPLP